jgi:glycosyltransferase involved in cell wall biosynthesis
MKIAYISNVRIPTEKAHGYQMCKTCEALSKQGVDIELIVPERENGINENAFSYYKIEESFKIKYLNSFDFLKYFSNKYGFYLQGIFFLVSLFRLKLEKDTIIYTRNPEIAWFFGGRYKTYFEAHNWPDSKIGLYKRLLKKTDGIICNSKGTEKIFNDNGFRKSLVAPNGVDLNDFAEDEDIEEVKKKFDLPREKKFITYVGHLYGWKGVDTILVAAKKNKQNEIAFLLIGGTEKDIQIYQGKIKRSNLNNIILIGHKKKEEIPSLMKISDILLLPNAKSTDESVKYTSPIKMFEYMASKRPIIASDLPSIREVLNEKNALFFSSGNADELLECINRLCSDGELVKSLSEQAYIDVRRYTWEKRAERISNYIKK